MHIFTVVRNVSSIFSYDRSEMVKGREKSLSDTAEARLQNKAKGKEMGQ